jgi:hypothetical protein
MIMGEGVVCGIFTFRILLAPLSHTQLVFVMAV